MLSAFNDWISSLKNFKTKNTTNFIRAGFTLDGSFEVEGEVTEPFSVSLPSAKGALDEPFVLDQIEMVHLREENEDLPRPTISLDLDIPDIGDLRNLSFGDIVRIVQCQFILSMLLPQAAHARRSATINCHPLPSWSPCLQPNQPNDRLNERLRNIGGLRAF